MEEFLDVIFVTLACFSNIFNLPTEILFYYNMGNEKDKDS